MASASWQEETMPHSSPPSTTVSPEMKQLVDDKPSLEKGLTNEPSQAAPTLRAEEKPRPDPSAQIGRPSCRPVLGVPDPNGAVLLMVIISVLYAFLTPWLIWRVAGEPTAFVWTTSLLASSYFFIGTICLSKTIRYLSILFKFRTFYIASLSAAAAYFIRPNSGAGVATLLTFYGAGAFGHAIAEYLQRVGSDHDESSINVVLDPESLATEKKKAREGDGYIFLFVHGVQSLLVLARTAWLVLHPASAVPIFAVGDVSEALYIVNELSLETLFVVWMWSAFTAVILQEEAVLSRSMMVYKVPVCAFGMYTLSLVVEFVAGEVAGLLTLWPVAMAMVGLFGYVLSMFRRYYHILNRDNRRLPGGITLIACHRMGLINEQDEQSMVLKLGA